MMIIELGVTMSPSSVTARSTGYGKRMFRQISTIARPDAMSGGFKSSRHLILTGPPVLFNSDMPNVYARRLNGMFSSAA